MIKKSAKAIPLLENYPLPKIGRARIIASIQYTSEAVSASVGLSGNKLYRKSDYLAYRDALRWLIKGKIGAEWDSRRYSFGLRARFFLGNERKIDLDNLIKPIMDAGNKLIWADDCQIIELYASIIRSHPEPKVEILIYHAGFFRDYYTRCHFCSKPLIHTEARKALNKKYCSRKCVANAQRKGQEIICLECGKIFWTGRYERLPRKRATKFCSRACFYQSIRQHGKAWVKHTAARKSQGPGADDGDRGKE